MKPQYSQIHFCIWLLEIKPDSFITFDQFSCCVINSHSCDKTFGPRLGQESLDSLAAICAFENTLVFNRDTRVRVHMSTPCFEMQ